MQIVPNNSGNVRDYVNEAINRLFFNDNDLHDEYDFRTYEALEKALTFQTAKEVHDRDSK